MADPQKFHTLVHSNYPRIVVGNSISKAFNSSSIQGGYAIVKDKGTREKLEQISLAVMKLIHNEFALMMVPIFYGEYGKLWLQLVNQKVGENLHMLK